MSRTFSPNAILMSHTKRCELVGEVRPGPYAPVPPVSPATRRTVAPGRGLRLDQLQAHVSVARRRQRRGSSRYLGPAAPTPDGRAEADAVDRRIGLDNLVQRAHLMVAQQRPADLAGIATELGPRTQTGGVIVTSKLNRQWHGEFPSPTLIHISSRDGIPSESVLVPADTTVRVEIVAGGSPDGRGTLQISPLASMD